MPRQSILVANDDAAYLSLIQELLTEEGYTDVQCVVGSQARTLIEQVIPDLVLLDINQANAGEAWKTLDILRLRPTTTHIPIICLLDRWSDAPGQISVVTQRAL